MKTAASTITPKIERRYDVEKGTLALDPKEVIREKGMTVEIYRRHEAGQIEKPSAEELMAKRGKYCEQLGLITQAELFDKELGMEEFAGKMYQEVSGYELDIWARFLPMAYSRKGGEWKEYNFDVIPTRVLEEISIASSLSVFHDIQIWTPEKRQIDPIAVGVISLGQQKRRYLISRWAESLKSFAQVELEVLTNLLSDDSYELIPEEALRALCDLKRANLNAYVRYAGKTLLRFCCGKRMHKVWLGHDVFDREYFAFCTECGKKKKIAPAY